MRQAAGSLPWIGVNDSAEEQQLRADHAARLWESVNFQLGGLEEAYGCPRPAACVAKETEAWQVSGT